jgi:hypothetical protein
VLERLVPWLDGEIDEAMLPEGVELPPSWNRSGCRTSWEPPCGRAWSSGCCRSSPACIGGSRATRSASTATTTICKREAHRRLAALPQDAEGRVREQRRIEAGRREYRAKLDDLARKYAMRVVVEWTQTMDLALPVQRLTVLIRRRKGERIIALDWNPLARRLEHPPCEFSHATDRHRLVCDDVLHLVSYTGLAPCANCGKPYCRACHRQHCPKCRHPAQCPVIAKEL